MWRAVLATTGSPGLQQTTADVLVLDVTQPAALALALEEGDEPVVVASHARDAHAAAVAASFLVAHRPDRLVAHVFSSHAPLATLVALSASLRLSDDAGHGISVWSDLLAASWSGVVLSSVTGLTSPNPPLSQHVRSWLPGSRFLVRLQPEPLSERADRPAVVLTGIGRGTHDMVVTEGGAQDEVVVRLTSTLAPGALRTVDLPGTWASVFGRREELQIAMLPVDVERVLRPRGPRCSGCGLSAAGSVCSFCRTLTGVTAPHAAPTGAATRAAAADATAADATAADATAVDAGPVDARPADDFHDDLVSGPTPDDALSGRTA